MTTDTTPTTIAAAVEPAELTPMQYALLDAFKDVALSAEAPGAKYATEQLARLTAEAFGYPLPEPVLREGGVVGFLYGNPRPQNSAASTAEAIATARQRRPGGGPVDRKRLALVAEREGEQLEVRTHADTPTPDEAVDLGTAEPWPFKPGVVVDDAEGAVTEWLDAAPEGTVVVNVAGDEWTNDGIAPGTEVPTWIRGRDRAVPGFADRITSAGLADLDPLTVVRVGGA
jgi:hypothetical protein